MCTAKDFVENWRFFCRSMLLLVSTLYLGSWGCSHIIFIVICVSDHCDQAKCTMLIDTLRAYWSLDYSWYSHIQLWYLGETSLPKFEMEMKWRITRRKVNEGLYANLVVIMWLSGKFRLKTQPHGLMAQMNIHIATWPQQAWVETIKNLTVWKEDEQELNQLVVELTRLQGQYDDIIKANEAIHMERKGLKIDKKTLSNLRLEHSHLTDDHRWLITTERMKTEHCNLKTNYKSLENKNNQLKLRHTNWQYKVVDTKTTSRQ